MFAPWIFGRDGAPTNPLDRSRLDTTPPPLYANRLGHYLLPHCASFKVEWSLNPKSDFVAGNLAGQREILWIDAGRTNDPVGQSDAGLDDPLYAIQEAFGIARDEEALNQDADEEGVPTQSDRLTNLLTASEYRSAVGGAACPSSPARA